MAWWGGTGRGFAAGPKGGGGGTGQSRALDLGRQSKEIQYTASICMAVYNQ